MPSAKKSQPHSEDKTPSPTEEIEEVTEIAEEEPKTLNINELELESLKEQLKEYKNKYLHLLAESENARKRMQKERQELIQFSLQNLIIDFLNPIDQMENALNCTEQMSEEVKNWAIGFQMILTQFKDVLSNNGVSMFESVGKAFDPHYHEAIDMIETEEYEPNIVVEENVRGYTMRDKVIRPARVKVSKQKE